jgi:hypothetical protein
MRGIDASAFCLGSIAPDCSDASDQDAFHTAHRLDDTGRFDYLGFYTEQSSSTPEKDLPVRSYILGYFSHLWFDAFARDAEETTLIEQPSEQPPDRQLLRSEIMGLDKSAVLKMSSSVEKPPRPIELPVIRGIDPARALQKYESTVAHLRHLQLGPRSEVFVSASAYSDFLASAEGGFRKCLDAL